MHKVYLVVGLCLVIYSSTVFIILPSLDTFNPIYNTSKATSFISTKDFENFDNISGITDGEFIVPNFIHFVKFSNPEFSFIDTVCVLAAFKNQKPEKIFIHTNLPVFKGKHWEKILSEPGLKEILEVKYKSIPKRIFAQGIPQNLWNYHGGDVARLEILMKYGGIYLDNDSYIVKSLDKFRRYEMTLGWQLKSNISNQVIIAHKNARFLKRWYLSYKNDYRSDIWFYNAGAKPTAILKKNPELIHRETKYIANFREIPTILFVQRNQKWKEHYAIHLLTRHTYMFKYQKMFKYPVIFNEKNILDYPISLQDMVAEVYPF